MQKKGIISLLFLCFATWIQAQITFNLTNTPAYYTPILDDIYVAGTFNNWNPADPAAKLIYNGSTWSLSLQLTVGQTYEYKFTRGSWASVESKADGSYLPNRSYTFNGGALVQNHSIAGWTDTYASGTHTATSGVKMMAGSFVMPQLSNRARAVWVWLPPDYYTSNKNYPVLYAQDAQNLFDAPYSFSGEWGVDEAMQTIASENRPVCIVIGVNNGGSTRLDEYSPWVNANYGGGEGDEYANFMVNTLKPYVDAHFRTLPDRENTALLGSSMGALISYYTALQYQQIVGKAALFSPSFWFNNATFSFPQTVGHQATMRLYLLGGGQESGVIADNQTIYTNLLTAGFSGNELNLQTRADGQHSEWFWQREFPNAYRWLFPIYTNTEQTGEEIRTLHIFPSPATHEIQIEPFENSDEKGVFSITNTLGQGIFEATQMPTTIDVSTWTSGIYTAKWTGRTTKQMRVAQFSIHQ